MRNKELSKTPYYLQIREQIYQKIVNGEYKPGDKLPSEEKLAQDFGVSRITVAKALSELVNRDYLQRIQGDGTYVGKPSIESNRGEVMGLSQSMTQRGFKLETTLLVREIIHPTRQISENLGIPLNCDVLHLKRLRRVNGEPVVLQDTWINLQQCPELVDVDFETGSLYESLRKLSNKKLMKTTDRYEAIAADLLTYEIMRVPLGFPLLQARRIAVLEEDLMFEYAESLYRSDLYTLEVING